MPGIELTGGRRADVPVYRRIANELRAEIAAGRLHAGGHLPSEHEIAARFGVSRGTASRAVAELAADGLVEAVPGRRRRISSGTGAIRPGAAYERLSADLAVRVRDLPAGSQLPGEHELASEHHVARGTVRRALEQLAAADLVVARPGRGWFVPTPGGAAPSSKHERVREKILRDISSGVYEHRLPGEGTLAVQLGVARSTVRRALQDLQMEGAVAVEPRRGRVVTGAMRRPIESASRVRS